MHGLIIKDWAQGYQGGFHLFFWGLGGGGGGETGYNYVKFLITRLSRLAVRELPAPPLQILLSYFNIDM